MQFCSFWALKEQVCIGSQLFCAVVLLLKHKIGSSGSFLSFLLILTLFVVLFHCFLMSPAVAGNIMVLCCPTVPFL